MRCEIKAFAKEKPREKKTRQPHKLSRHRHTAGFECECTCCDIREIKTGGVGIVNHLKVGFVPNPLPRKGVVKKVLHCGTSYLPQKIFGCASTTVNEVATAAASTAHAVRAALGMVVSVKWLDEDQDGGSGCRKSIVR